MILIYDYGVGNVRSLRRAFERLGCTIAIGREPEAIASARGIIFPGVGSFGAAMEAFSGQSTVELRKRVEAGLPVLGICLGMQIMFSSSDEAEGIAGLCWLEGRVKRLKHVRVPHMGWSKVRPVKEGILSGPEHMYFAHSFYAEGVSPDAVAAVCEHERGMEFTAAVSADNIMGFQFHPEKSQEAGVEVLQSFVAKCRGGR